MPGPPLAEGAGAGQLRAALAFLQALARDRATSVRPVPGGVAVLTADFPFAHDHNKLLISGECTAREVADAADDVLGGAGLRHRLVEVFDLALARRLAAGLATRGYAAREDLVMAVRQPLPRELPPLPVVELPLDERIGVARRGWQDELPDHDPVVSDQLGRRISTVLPAAEATFLAVRDPAGAVVARTDLYLRDGVAQVEEVITDPAHRGRGLASLLVLTAVARAREAGADLVFLHAEAEDWPQHLYRRLGFVDLGRTVAFTGESAPPTGPPA